MGFSTGNGGLKCLQWLFRGIQFICSVVVLGIYAYFLANMASQNMTIPTSIKAVVGIAIVSTVYTLVGIFLVCCLAGHKATSFIAIVIDVGLIGAYVYVAVTNRDGATSCSGARVGSPFGTGDAAATPAGSDSGFVGLPSFGVLCRMESACLAAACIAIFFFILSILLEISMNRGRARASRPSRHAEAGMYQGKPDHYSAPRGGGGLRGLMAGALPFRNTRDPDSLPMHQQPSQVTTRREPVETWGEVQSLHDSDRLYFNDGRESRDGGEEVPIRFKETTAPRPAAGLYHEGDEHVEDREYNLYREDSKGHDLSEIGSGSRQRENRDARIERLTTAYN